MDAKEEQPPVGILTDRDLDMPFQKMREIRILEQQRNRLVREKQLDLFVSGHEAKLKNEVVTTLTKGLHGQRNTWRTRVYTIEVQYIMLLCNAIAILLAMPTIDIRRQCIKPSQTGICTKPSMLDWMRSTRELHQLLRFAFTPQPVLMLPDRIALKLSIGDTSLLEQAMIDTLLEEVCRFIRLGPVELFLTAVTAANENRE